MNEAMSPEVVVLISADAEWKAVRKIFAHIKTASSPYGECFEAPFGERKVMLVQGGWGKISAAASTQYVSDQFHPRLLVNLGTCGGFSGSIECGQTLLVNETLVYDIIEQMSDATEAIQHYSVKMDLSWLKEPFPIPVRVGRLVSGDRDIVPADIPILKKQYHAVAADWESGSIAWVAKRNQIPCLILRTVSDVVNETGSEVYADYAGFQQLANESMAMLLESLPAWLNCCHEILT